MFNIHVDETLSIQKLQIMAVKSIALGVKIWNLTTLVDVYDVSIILSFMLCLLMILATIGFDVQDKYS